MEQIKELLDELAKIFPQDGHDQHSITLAERNFPLRGEQTFLQIGVHAHGRFYAFRLATFDLKELTARELVQIIVAKIEVSEARGGSKWTRADIVL